MQSTLHILELTLWHSETRFDRALMARTLAPDFHEFGRSGRHHTRDDLPLDATVGHPIDATLHDFADVQLSDTIAHCTHLSELRSPTGTEWDNRSSFWGRSSGQWQLRFHQGTPTHPPAQIP